MSKKLAFLMLGTAVIMAAGVQCASATTREVGNCTSNPHQYPTIQAAVTATVNGDTVEVCPGTYNEQVMITTAITLRNVPHLASPTIAIPAGGAQQNTYMLPPNQTFPAAAQILVAPSSPLTVNVEYLTVDGSNNNIQTCGEELFGIYYQNAGGKIENNTTQNQMLPSGYQGCQSGEGIFVENQTSGTPALTISNNTVGTFDKNGITVSYNGDISYIDDNTVTGIGPTTVIAQNGIQLGFAATGHIKGNTVSNLAYIPCQGCTAYGSSGILLYDIPTGGLTLTEVLDNNVTNSQYGVILDAVQGTSAARVEVTGNTVSGASFAGVGLYSDPYVPLNDDYVSVTTNTINGTTPYDNIDACSDFNKISGNTANGSTESGIHLDGQCAVGNENSGISNNVSGNTIDNNCVGILSGPALGQNNIGRNTMSGNTNNFEYGADSWSCSAHKYMGKHHAGERPHFQPLTHVAQN